VSDWRVFAAALVLACALPSDAAAQAGGLIALPPLAHGPNVVENPGFEARAVNPDAERGGTASTRGWRLRPDGPVWSVDGAAREGRAALKMTAADKDSFVATADQTVTLEPGWYTIQAWVRTDGLGTTSPRNGARLCLDGRPRINWWKCTSVARGSTDWTKLERLAVPVQDRGPYRVTIGAYGKPEGTAWFDDVSVSRVKTPPLDAFLLYPNYRGMLFDDRSQTVRVALSVPSDAPAAARRIVVALADEAGGAARQQREYPVAAARGERLVAELDARTLAAGEYVVRAMLVDASGEEVFTHPGYRIVKAPATARERMAIWYDDRNVTHLGGKPAFVLGLYTTSGFSTSRAAYATGRDGWANERIAEAPVNMLINYWLGATPVPALQTYMDDLHARGIRYLQTVNFYHRSDPQYAKLPYPAAGDGEDALNRWVGTTLAKHPALAGFYTADERTAEMVPTVFRQHRELRRAAPGTVTYAVLGNGWQEQAPLWRDAADVLGLDPYPVTKAGDDNHLAMVGEWTRLGQDAVMRSRPLWMVLQFFPVTRQAGWPTREQLHRMSWMAIVEGARGLFYWSFGNRGLAWVKDEAERRRYWSDLVAVTKEIKALEPVLLAPDATIVREAPNATLRTLGKRMPDGTRYLFAYNATSGPAAARWTLAEPAREIVSLDGTPAPSLDGSVLGDRLAPYEVKRYRIR
jgi:hypothetical protein